MPVAGRQRMPIPEQDGAGEEPTVRIFMRTPNDEKPTIFSKNFGKLSSTKKCI